MINKQKRFENLQFQVFDREFNSIDIFFQVLAALGLGLVMGIACYLFSSLIVLGILIGIISSLVIIKRPEIGICGILIATSSIVFEDQLPQISLSGISIHLSDFLLLGLLAIIVVRWLSEPKFTIVHTPLDWPLLLFYGAMLLSTFLAISHSSLDLVTARRMLRVLSYYLTFFIVTNLIRERYQLNFLVNSLFVLATIVAGVMVAQFILGHSMIIIPGRVENLATVGVDYEGITRIIPPGLSIVLVAFITIFCILVFEKFKPQGLFMFFQVGLLGMAVLFTFLRSYWAVLLTVFLLLGFIFRGSERQKYLMWILTIIFTVAIMLFLVVINQDTQRMKVVGASIDRLNSLFRGETFQGQDSSFNYRVIETQYALPQIISHPLIGMGMGANYRPLDSRLDWGEIDGRNFIHNGHLSILIQSGLLGYVCLMWLSMTFLIRGFRYWRGIPNNWMRGVFLGYTLIYLVVMVAAVVNSTFMQWAWTPVIGIIMGTNEVILRNVGRVESAN